MVLSKKQALIIAATVIAGTGIGFMVLGDKGDDNGEESEQIAESKKDLLIHYEAPVYAPSDIYAPYTETTTTNIVHNVTTKISSLLPSAPPSLGLPTDTRLLAVGTTITGKASPHSTLVVSPSGHTAEIYAPPLTPAKKQPTSGGRGGGGGGGGGGGTRYTSTTGKYSGR